MLKKLTREEFKKIIRFKSFEELMILVKQAREPELITALELLSNPISYYQNP